MKKLLVSILMLTLVLSVSCTSKNDTDSDQETAEAVDPSADLEGSDESQAAASDDGSADDFAEDEEVVADTGDESLPDESMSASENTNEAGSSGEVVAEDIAGTTTEDGSVSADAASSEVSASDTSSDESVFDSSATTDSPVAESEVSSPEISSESTALLDSPVAKPNIPLQKIKDTPYSHGGQLLNAVYIGRPGDTVSSVSSRIYGADRSADLKAANSFLNRREIKVGDKIYYNSPKRPQDGERMLTFYEDSGIPAQSYVSKSGENIRTVSKNLLGDKDSWKEVWATNLAVESKGELDEGTELRYWPDTASVAPIAANTPSSSPSELPVEPGPSMGEVANNDPADDFAMPEDMGAAAGTIAAEPPPPPPPPPPTVQSPSKQVASSSDKDMTFMLSAGGLLLVGVGIILAIARRSRSKKISMNTNTQI